MQAHHQQQQHAQYHQQQQHQQSHQMSGMSLSHNNINAASQGGNMMLLSSTGVTGGAGGGGGGGPGASLFHGHNVGHSQSNQQINFIVGGDGTGSSGGIGMIDNTNRPRSSCGRLPGIK